MSIDVEMDKLANDLNQLIDKKSIEYRPKILKYIKALRAVIAKHL